jgi:hypothetical protein
MNTNIEKFDNGERFPMEAKDLDALHVSVVDYMNTHNLSECLITCPSKISRRVRRTGEKHWNHDGFSFD